MTKSWLIGTTALMLLASGAYAADEKPMHDGPPPEGMEHGAPPMGGPEGKHGDWVPYDKLTLEQARKHAHEKADKLDKMTQAEWDAHKKEVMERHDKWKTMTPEERAKQHDAWKSKHSQDHAEKTGAAPAPDDKPVAK